MMHRIALVIEYDGTRYAGFQLQSSVDSIQGQVEQAVERTTGIFSRVYGAGRTDAGVHASGQVASFDTASELSMDTLRSALNYYLPNDIAVRHVNRVHSRFNPRKDAVVRTYRYVFLESAARSPLRDRFSYHVGRPIDVMASKEALRYLEGTRDFGPFCGTLPESERTVRNMYRAEAWRQNSDEIVFEFAANAYLNQQVRRMAALGLKVGLGKITLGEFISVADSGIRGIASLVLPARGLTLQRVEYGNHYTLSGNPATEKIEVMVG